MGRDWRRHANTRKGRYPELCRGNGRARLVIAGEDGADGPRKRRISCGVWQVRRVFVCHGTIGIAVRNYWASWADALPMISQRNPNVANLERMSGEGPPEGCLGQLRECAQQLDHEGFWWRPSWSALRRGARPDKVDGEPGEWQHGWQCWSSSVSDANYRKRTMLLAWCWPPGPPSGSFREECWFGIGALPNST